MNVQRSPLNLTTSGTLVCQGCGAELPGYAAGDKIVAHYMGLVLTRVVFTQRDKTVRHDCDVERAERKARSEAAEAATEAASDPGEEF